MFITRKRFEEAIAKAAHEAEERLWREHRMERMESELHKRMCDIEKRLSDIEFNNLAKKLEESEEVSVPKPF